MEHKEKTKTWKVQGNNPLPQVMLWILSPQNKSPPLCMQKPPSQSLLALCCWKQFRQRSRHWRRWTSWRAAAGWSARSRLSRCLRLKDQESSSCAPGVKEMQQDYLLFHYYEEVRWLTRLSTTGGKMAHLTHTPRMTRRGPNTTDTEQKKIYWNFLLQK